MSKEVRCPNCGTVISIDEDAYNSIAVQVRDAEMEAEVERRVEAEKIALKSKYQVAVAKVDAEQQEKLIKKEQELKELTAKLDSIKTVLTRKMNEKRDQYDSEIKAVRDQVNSLQQKLSNAEADKNLAVNAAIGKQKDLIRDRDRHIAELEAKVKTKDEERNMAVNNAVAAVNTKVIELQAELKSKDDKFKAMLDAKEAEKNLVVNNAKSKINALETEVQAAKDKAVAVAKEERDKCKIIIDAKDEEIKHYKEFKSKLSVKLIGESLEQHCSEEFDRIQPFLPLAQFGKDNDVSSETRSKGDFIFRDFDKDGNEIISIMFEMKNEAEGSANKHKNSDFYDKLDRDRKEKKCEYAVLVTTLEADSDYYNSGIVVANAPYEKMYVVRPQCFIPIITILRNAALNSLEIRKELEELKAKDVDVSSFESDLLGYQSTVHDILVKASGSRDSAIKGIDKAIQQLESVKKSILSELKYIERADKKAQDLSVRGIKKKYPSVGTAMETAKLTSVPEVTLALPECNVPKVIEAEVTENVII